MTEYIEYYKSKTVPGLTEQMMSELNCDFFTAMINHIWKGKGWLALQMAMYRFKVKDQILDKCRELNISNKIIKKIAG